MPTYDFRCPAGHDFERFFGKISDAPSETPCPECGAVATRRISGGAGLLFKGSGFYITDYGKDGKKDQKPAAAKSTSEGGDAAKKGGEGTSASGPAAGGSAAPAGGSGGAASGDSGGSSAGGAGGSSSKPAGGS